MSERRIDKYMEQDKTWKTTTEEIFSDLHEKVRIGRQIEPVTIIAILNKFTKIGDN